MNIHGHLWSDVALQIREHANRCAVVPCFFAWFSREVLVQEGLANQSRLCVCVHAVFVRVNIEERSDSIDEKGLRYFKTLIVKLGNFDSQELVDITFIYQYKFFTSVLHGRNEIVYVCSSNSTF